MALDKSILVDIPEHGIAYKKVAGKTYVYYVTAAYRNLKGKPTCDRIAIGRLDEETLKLIPNRSYYEVYLNKPAPQTKGIFECGVYDVFNKISKKVGLKSILKKYFPENHVKMLTVAQYMLAEGNVMYYLDDYTESHYTELKGIMQDVQASRMFSALRQEDILLFFHDWMKHKKANEYVAYDVTSISSYSKNISELEWGYNRDKERLPQINMGMYYGEESKMPLYYRVYPGSISDKAHLKYMLCNNEFINGKRTRFVMDRGFYSGENLNYLVKNGYRFVIALPGSLKYLKDIVKSHGEEIKNHSKYRIGQGLPYGNKYETTVLGFRMNVHLYYDNEKAVKEMDSLYALIDSQENDLKMMTEPPDKKLHYDKYFYINRGKDGKMSFKRNNEAIDEEILQCGYFAIAETDFTKTSAEILEIYRNRDVIEKGFDELKNETDLKRLRTQSSEAVEGKIFVAFLALIVRGYMLNKLTEYMRKNNYTLKKIIYELSKLKCVDLHPSNSIRFTNPLTKTQREIYELLCIDIPDCIG